MTERLRVIRVIARLNVGGPARHVVLLDKGLRQDAFDTCLLYGEPDPGEASLEHLIVEAGVSAERIRGLGRAINVIDDVRALLRIVRIVFRSRPDVVHTHTAKAGVLGRLAAALFNATRRRAKRCLVVHTFHGNVLSGYFGRFASLLVRLVERLMAHINDRIIVIADQQRHEIVDRFRVAPARKVLVIPLGLDLDPLLALAGTAEDECRAALGYSREESVFAYVGRFVPIKNLAMMVRALAVARPRAPQARLLMVGDGPTRGELQRLTASLGLSDIVRFVGWREDLTMLYAATDAAILSSVNEGTPVALIEAMAACRPAIATSVGGVRDLVIDGKTGVLVTLDDVEAMASAIVRLCDFPEERRMMGTRARLHVASRYDQARLIADVAGLYRAGVAEKRLARTPSAVAPG